MSYGSYAILFLYFLAAVGTSAAGILFWVESNETSQPLTGAYRIFAAIMFILALLATLGFVSYRP